MQAASLALRGCLIKSSFSLKEVSCSHPALTFVLEMLKDGDDGLQGDVVGQEELPGTVLLKRLPLQALDWCRRGGEGSRDKSWLSDNTSIQLHSYESQPSNTPRAPPPFPSASRSPRIAVDAGQSCISGPEKHSSLLPTCSGWQHSCPLGEGV